jgi:hypothetical protein
MIASSGTAMRALSLSVIVLSQRDLQGLPEANCACVRVKNNSWVRMTEQYPLVLADAGKPAKLLAFLLSANPVGLAKIQLRRLLEIEQFSSHFRHGFSTLQNNSR